MDTPKSFLNRIIFNKILYPLGETFGIPGWCRKPALGGLDDKLARYLDFRNGVFVEAGANDGYSQSNTFYLEKGLKWKGVLVEAIPDLFEKCRKQRPQSKVFNAGLVSKSYVGKTLKLHYANLMSIAEGSIEESELKRHVQAGLEVQGIEKSYSVEVPAVTFESIIEKSGFQKIDLLSLDLEGYEIEALKGWNFERHRPSYILIEVWSVSIETMDNLMKSNFYERVDQLSIHDYLYQDAMIIDSVGRDSLAVAGESV
ncbi:MAG: hypothetical protein RLZZ179_1416 [Verrucomicrobiota bacterium]